MVIERPNVLWCMMAQCLNAPYQRLPENFALQYLKFSATERDATGERQRLPCQDCVGLENGTFCSTTHILHTLHTLSMVQLLLGLNRRRESLAHDLDRAHLWFL